MSKRRARPSRPSPPGRAAAVRRPSAVATLFPVALIALAGLVTWRSSFAGAFVLDDGPAIVNNPNVRSLWPLAGAMSAPPEVTVAGRPIVSLTLALNYAAGGIDPWGYHAVNLAIHVLAALALFGVVRLTLGTIPIALVVALIWLVHPLQTGSVTYVVQRAESLMGLFYLLTLYCAIRALEPAADPARRRVWIAASVVSCALGMGSKEVMVSAPIVVWIWDWLFAKRASADERGAADRRMLYAGLACTWVILAGLIWTHPRTHSIGFGFADWPWWRYAITQIGVVAHYLRLAIVPLPLVLDYGWPSATSIADVWLQALVLAALLALTIRLLVRRRPEAFLGVWFFLILAPTSSVVPVVTEVAAEHRMYLPLASVVAAIVLGVQWALRRAGGEVARSAGGAIAAVVVILFAWQTDARNQDYQSEERIWRDTVTKRPGNARAHNNYGVDLLLRNDSRAADEFRAAVAIDPQFADAHANLGVALCRAARCDEGTSALERALALDPSASHVHKDLGEAYASQGKMGPAAEQFLKALEDQRDDVFLLNRAGWILATSADDRVRDRSKALALAQRAVELTKRRDEVSLDTLAAALANAGRFDEAVAAGGEALAVAREKGEQAIVPELEARLALYRKGQPYRE